MCVVKTSPGFPTLIPYFFTTLSTEKVNKIADCPRQLFITSRIFVSYSALIRLFSCKRVVYRFRRV
ncbi:hypothetical protein CHU32_06040 [Superficieibacter electus]|uniref:Uncharacterized protein n=1 Tax=Superficieibacter electus TaxID=2022662 RepID=A0A2P5GT96_9ENTR|nr:hypothetical protein CHU33_06025 [Superficieibacter electus]POP49784.1 hypothetical protein CHU32_06040 [Superficieibacter electus]